MIITSNRYKTRKHTGRACHHVPLTSCDQLWSHISCWYWLHSLTEQMNTVSKNSQKEHKGIVLINSFKISSNQLQRARPWALNINRWSLSLYVRNAGEPYANCSSPLALCPLFCCSSFLPTAEKPPDPFRQAIALLIDTSSPIPWLFAALCWHRYMCRVPYARLT